MMLRDALGSAPLPASSRIALYSRRGSPRPPALTHLPGVGDGDGAGAGAVSAGVGAGAAIGELSGLGEGDGLAFAVLRLVLARCPEEPAVR